ncbi:protein ripply1 [Mustela erminea]|uniref:protein ripply1 n=1 Tax=Mustela erminea TaxID=36723 RepID=UPI001386AD0D|nr:protein ripply1 [Mustela erminea]XP_032187672.1 protein ripply1 [Mustela erminea]
MQEVLRNESPYGLPGLNPLRMDPPVPAAAAPVPAPVLALAPVQHPRALPDLLSPSVLVSSGQQVGGKERGACLWRPWLSSTSDSSSQVWRLIDSATGGPTGAEVTKTDSKFHHPVRLFWPKSRSFDYLYSDGEILLQNFPVQATINLYEDSDSEEEEEEEERDKEEETEERGPEECVRVPRSAPHTATVHLPSLLLTCPN